jgi:hypothetical protein
MFNEYAMVRYYEVLRYLIKLTTATQAAFKVAATTTAKLYVVGSAYIQPAFIAISFILLARDILF